MSSPRGGGGGGGVEHRWGFYDFLQKVIKIPTPGLECRDYFEFCNNNTRSNNLFKIRMKSAKVNAFKYSFFMRIIKEWNNLPHHLFGNDININKFKFNLKKWMNIT